MKLARPPSQILRGVPGLSRRARGQRLVLPDRVGLESWMKIAAMAARLVAASCSICCRTDSARRCVFGSDRALSTQASSATLISSLTVWLFSSARMSSCARSDSLTLMTSAFVALLPACSLLLGSAMASHLLDGCGRGSLSQIL